MSLSDRLRFDSHKRRIGTEGADLAPVGLSWPIAAFSDTAGTPAASRFETFASARSLRAGRIGVRVEQIPEMILVGFGFGHVSEGLLLDSGAAGTCPLERCPPNESAHEFGRRRATSCATMPPRDQRVSRPSTGRGSMNSMAPLAESSTESRARPLEYPLPTCRNRITSWPAAR